MDQNQRQTGKKLAGSAAVIDALAAQAWDNGDKAFVIRNIGALVAAGQAEWEMCDNGDIEVRFGAGETYLLAATTILRLA